MQPLALTYIGTIALVAVQAAALLVDEFYFHRRRRLGLFETVGHPVDSLAFLAALSVLVFREPDSVSLTLFVALAVFSTLLVTKDEWVHAAACTAGEHWLHAVLFVVHAPVLIGLGVLWFFVPDTSLPAAVALPVAGFALYQASYWGIHHAQSRADVPSQPATGEQRLLRQARRPLV